MPRADENVLLTDPQGCDLAVCRLPEPARFLALKPLLQRCTGLLTPDQIVHGMALILGGEKTPNGCQDLQSDEWGRIGRESSIVNHQHVFWKYHLNKLGQVCW